MKNTIKSWVGKKVRIKREYIKTETDDDGETYSFIDIDNGLDGLVDDPINAVFSVKMAIFGVDLYYYRDHDFEVGSVEPTHQIILEGVNNRFIAHPFVWDSKYFERVREVTTTTWEPLEEIEETES